MFLKEAFNIMTRLHSRAATLKRLGSPDIYSPVRITPSNYFRFLEGPSATVIHGREFILPVDTMTGHVTKLISFATAPTTGQYYLNYNATSSTEIQFDDSAATIQTILRVIPALANVLVTGDVTTGFLVTFVGIQTPASLVSFTVLLPIDSAISIAPSTSVLWSPVIKRADKIIDSVYGSMAIDEIVEMVDIGGDIMGFRVRME